MSRRKEGFRFHNIPSDARPEGVEGDRGEILDLLSKRIPGLFSMEEVGNTIRTLVYGQDIVIGYAPGSQHEKGGDTHIFFRSKTTGSIYLADSDGLSPSSVMVSYSEAEGEVYLKWTSSLVDDICVDPEKGILLDIFEIRPPGVKNGQIPTMMIDEKGNIELRKGVSEKVKVALSLDPEREIYLFENPPSKYTCPHISDHTLR
ncbi:MAG: hypothetical protein Q7S61_01840 [bacterium]|nr:hypothetical protein [bacterium]